MTGYPWLRADRREVLLSPTGRVDVRLPRPPDAAVTARLRAELQRARASGVPFAEVWPAALAAAVAGLPRAEREGWLDAFRATGPAWACAYNGGASEGWVGMLAAA